MKPIIEVKNIGKKYTINHNKGGYVALRDVLTEALRAPLAFFKKKVLTTKEPFWALKDVNFTVEKGEVIGIIGKNGAGKSTLLKILSRITPPTTGEIKIHGTVGSLLEVGTGFHPELTGRENIFLNGAILGMKKAEIVQKFDEIVAFAGIEQFLDTPVKYYSSGMYVRLAFSVAAHMEPDILIIDEVLAVGDAEFQKKCLGKMEELTKKDGRTILFVSHNMGALRRLCNRSILLSKGTIEKIGKTNDVIDTYLTNGENFISTYQYPVEETRTANITKISIIDSDGKYTSRIPISKSFSFEIEYEFSTKESAALLSILFYFSGELFFITSESDNSGNLYDYSSGKYKTRITVPAYLFNVGIYHIEVALHRPYIEYLDNKVGLSIEILDIDNVKSKIFGGRSEGKIGTILNYQTTKI